MKPRICKRGCLKCLWKCYSQYYSSEVQRQLAAGIGTHDVAVHLRLSVLGAIDTPTFTRKILSFRHVENVKNVENNSLFQRL